MSETNSAEIYTVDSWSSVQFCWVYFCYQICVHYFIIVFLITFQIWVKIQTYAELSEMYRAEWRIYKTMANPLLAIHEEWKQDCKWLSHSPFHSWILTIDLHYLLPELGWHRWNDFNSGISTIVLIYIPIQTIELCALLKSLHRFGFWPNFES